MSLWIWITLFAALVQTLRFMLQKRLKGIGLSTGGATFSRFLFAAPLAALAALTVLTLGGEVVPRPSAAFFGFALLGGLAQVIATFLTVALFSLRNFAVGVAFTKTETVQVALFSWLVLGEVVGAFELVAIAVGIIGVILLIRGAKGVRFDRRAALYGVAAGALFGISAIGYRGATAELLPMSFVARALVALSFVTCAQSIGMAIYLRMFEPNELSRVLQAWRKTVWVGVTGVLGSAGWFAAFSLQNAALVRAVGQVEIVFTLLVSALVFKERLSARELGGMALVIISLLMIVAAT
ncbi:EamA family transporter [Albirhodobacter sp. R86504]|uniref:EamA family transporter n=1 Tax=Albirhodobacter sp. R86504 TaxID=3093848 RepID=UPI0036705B36